MGNGWHTCVVVYGVAISRYLIMGGYPTSVFWMTISISCIFIKVSAKAQPSILEERYKPSRYMAWPDHSRKKKRLVEKKQIVALWCNDITEKRTYNGQSKTCHTECSNNNINKNFAHNVLNSDSPLWRKDSLCCQAPLHFFFSHFA